MTTTTLIAELKKAKKGSRELDAYICCEMSTEAGPFFNPFLGEDDSWYVQAGIGGFQMKHSDFPHYTTNLQDAVNLMPEGWRVYSLQQSHHGDLRWCAGIDKVHAAEVANSGVIDGGPALALCIAILKSMEIEA